MKATIEDISSVKKKITIEVEPDAVIKEMEKTITEIVKRAKIPGFRPGKAPKNIVEKHYGSEVHTEVLNRLISTCYLQAVQNNKMNPVEMPVIDNVSALSKGSPLSFVATVEVRPNIELGIYDGIEVKEHDIVVKDEEVNQTVERLREMYAQLEVVEGRPLENNDTAIIDFEGFRDGKSIDGAKAVDYLLTLGTKSFIMGFEEQLAGMNRGETREIKVTFPTNYTKKELAGKDVSFTVVLKEIKKKLLPELNDEFAKDLGDYKSVDELKETIKKDIETRKRNELATAQREEILSKLVESHTFENPPVMVHHELQSMAHQQATRMARRGVDVMKTFDIAKFREENTALAEKRVKGLLILDIIAEKEKIEVNDQEVTTALNTMAKASGQSVDSIEKYYETHEGGLENLRSSLKQEKTLGLLLSRAKKSYN
jgi:trigger factor